MKRFWLSIAVWLALILTLATPQTLVAQIHPVKSIASAGTDPAPAYVVRQPTADEIRLVDEIINLIRKSYYQKLTEQELSNVRAHCLIVVRQDPTMPCFQELDPHTLYEPPANSNAPEPPNVGIGVTVARSENPPGILVEDVLENGPAERAGVRAGDIITAIDGHSTRVMSLERAVELLRGWRVEGTTVRVTIERDGETLSPMIITRGRIVVPNVSKRLLPGGIGYVRLRQFSNGAYRQLLTAIYMLEKENGRPEKKNRKPLSGLIFDMRGNPGGNVQEAFFIANLFLSLADYLEESGVVDENAATMVQTEHRGAVLRYMGVFSVRDVLGGMPLVILVNGACASACELVSGVLRSHGRAIIAGTERTWGKGMVQTLIPLESGGQLRLTTDQFLVGPKGCEQTIQQIGLEPDIFVTRRPHERPEGMREGNLPYAPAPFFMPNENCRYNFSVPSSHWGAAREMLRAFGLTPIATPEE